MLNEVKKGNEVKARYRYLSDGTKLRVRDGSGANGYDYLSSLIYRKSSAGEVLEGAAFSDGRIIKGGSGYEVDYFLSDHLGSVRAVVNGSTGEVKERNDYYPFGLRQERSDRITSDNRFRYNGKEEQTTGDLGYLDYGARMYDAEVGRWFGVDPKAEKYFGISPYGYCMNNPILFIDLKGEEIWITDNNGNRVLYTPFMFYQGKDTFIQQVIIYLDNMYLTDNGDYLLEGLICSSHSFDIMNLSPYSKKQNISKTLVFKGNEAGGGMIYGGAIMLNSVDAFKKMESLAHELFHGYQHEKGQGGASLFNEVEANLFAYNLTSMWAMDHMLNGGWGSSTRLGNETKAGKIYQDAFEKLSNVFDSKAFKNVIMNFKRGSMNNTSGLYNHYPIRLENQKKVLIKTFYPLK